MRPLVQLVRINRQTSPPAVMYAIPVIRNARLAPRYQSADSWSTTPMTATPNSAPICLLAFKMAPAILASDSPDACLKEISPRTLSLRLKELEEAGIVNRTIYSEIPPHVVYSLTEKGLALRPVFDAMKEWGDTWGV